MFSSHNHPAARFRFLLPLFLMAVGGAVFLPSIPADAATVALTVIDEQDSPIADTVVTLRKLDAARPTSYPNLRVTSDSQGHALFTSLEPGRYEVQLGRQTQGFVQLRGHPSVAPSTITVGADEAQLQTTIRFLRGTPVVFRNSADGSNIPWSRIQLQDLDREFRTEIKMNELIEREVRLPSGRWTARAVPVPGYLLTSVEVNRNPFPHDIAEFDLPFSLNPWYVSFEYTAPSRVWGTVHFEGEPFDVRVIAGLLEAGPWLPAVQARGGSKYDSIGAHPRRPRWDYEMTVPDGTWSIRVEGDTLDRAEPAQLELQLAPGEDRRIDFTVSGTAEDGLNLTLVVVREPNGRRARGAIVEVWPSDPEARAAAEAPIAKGIAEWGEAFLRGVNGRELMFVAGMPGFVEVVEVTEVPVPESGFGRLTLTLEAGGTIHATALDEEQQPIPGITARLSLLEGDGSVMQSREIVRWAEQPTGSTDSTGHLWLRGIYPGRYMLTGDRNPDSGGMYFAEFRYAGERDWSREVEMEFVAAEADEMEIRLAEAGSIQATFHCSDGSALPEEADLLILPVGAGYSRMDSRDWPQEATLVRSNFVLEGRQRDSARLGPLDFDSYYFVTRPQGHNRWTWAIGGELPEDAALIEVAPGEPTDLGTIEIDCTPAISVQPVTADESDLPDLSSSTVFDPPADCTGTLAAEDEDVPIDPPRLQAFASRVEFRDLPEGEVDLTVKLWNPFFLPEPELRVSVEATLQRGNTLHLKPDVAGIGGAIAVTLPEGDAGRFAAVRLARVDPSEESAPFKPRIFQLDGDEILIPSVPAGRYDLSACIDPECVEYLQLWEPLPVEPAVLLIPPELAHKPPQ